MILIRDAPILVLISVSMPILIILTSSRSHPNAPILLTLGQREISSNIPNSREIIHFLTFIAARESGTIFPVNQEAIHDLQPGFLITQEASHSTVSNMNVFCYWY